MGNATGRDIHVDRMLTEMAIGYRPEGFIADMISPIVNVGKQSDLYPVFSRADRLRREDTKRAPGTYAHSVTEDVGSGTYFAQNFALSSPLVLEDKKNMDPVFVSELQNGKSTYLIDKLYLDWEMRVASQVTSASNVGSSSAVSSAWNGAGNPLGDMNTALDNVRYSNGVRANRIVFGLAAWQAFRRDSTIRNLIFGTNNGGGYPNTEQVKALLEVDEILIGGAFQNTGEEGQVEELQTVWEDHVLAYYAPMSPTRDRPSFSYSFRWVQPGLPNLVVERHPYDSRRKAEDIEVGYYQDEKITGSSYGFLLTAVNSST